MRLIFQLSMFVFFVSLFLFVIISDYKTWIGKFTRNRIIKKIQSYLYEKEKI